MMIRRFFLLPFSIIVLLVACSTVTGESSIPEGSIRDISALELVADMGVGVNIGNTFDSLNTGGVAGETGWGNPRVTREYIRALKQHGYETIRLPVSWVDYMGSAPGYVINTAWMNRIAEVTSWILDEDMYCIINLHHDGGGEANGNAKYWIKKITSDEENVTARFATVWGQIVRRFAATSDKLILEAMNEMGFDNVWNRWSSGNTQQKQEAYRLLNKLNQTFVDAVRSTGGNNDERFLLVSGYWTDIDQTCDELFQMPQDTADDKLILSVHYYTPSTFCIAEAIDNGWGFRADWGTDATRDSDTRELNRQFDKLNNSFISKGIPIILGEYGVTKMNKDVDSRTRWMTDVTQICLDNGICPVLWDTGMRSNNQGMADIRRTSPYNMSAELTAVWNNLKLP